MIAKIASSSKKPNGITIIESDMVKEFLFPLKVSKISGVGIKTNQALEKIGIKTIEELANANSLKLIEVFGKSKGVFLHKSSLGIDEREVEENYERQHQ